MNYKNLIKKVGSDSYKQMAVIFDTTSVETTVNLKKLRLKRLLVEMQFSNSILSLFCLLCWCIKFPIDSPEENIHFHNICFKHYCLCQE